MSDAERIADLIRVGSDSALLQHAQHEAARKLLKFDGEIYPADGCAITLSCELQAAGVAIPDTFQALTMVALLEKRGWKKVAVGDPLRPGDVGTTCYGGVAHHGVDHVYLVLRPVNANENVIADNQRHAPHLRSVSGHPDGKSPTRMFLRAV
jgi:hypothetical protein